MFSSWAAWVALAWIRGGVEPTWTDWLAANADLPLDEALHRVAVEEGATLTLAELRRQLDELAAGVVPAADPVRRLQNLVRHLFDDLGFRGDDDTYDDPANSRIDHVLAARRGLPILLSALTMEVGRRAGVSLVGVGFPSHFLVSTTGEPRLFVDAFHGGRLLRAVDLELDLRTRFGALDDAQVAVALGALPTTDLLVRVSTNLVAAWTRRGDPAAALRNADRRVALRPDVAALRRDRGTLRAETGDADGALVDLSGYLDECPDAPDAARIRWSLLLLAQNQLPGRL